MDWESTNSLRFERRVIYGDGTISRFQDVLQQAWRKKILEGHPPYDYEWRDVPVKTG